MADETRTDDEQTSAPVAGDSVLPPPLAAGDRLGGYRIDAPCGTGGFGTVYRATADDGRVVALKVLHHYLAADERTAARFRREASAVGRVDHPGVVQVLDVGVDDGRLYIAMDWVDGRTVKQQLARGGPMSLGEARAILAPLCAALAAVHAAGVVHRDVKASNVMIGTEAGELRVTLLDFGIAKLFERDTGAPMSFTSTAATIGSPHAMAPEQFRGGPIDGRTDVYAVGVLLHEMLTGRAPFVARTAADLRALHLEVPPPPASERAPVPAAVDDLIRRCMAKRPADRIQTAREIPAALAAATDGLPEPPPAVAAVAAYVSVEPIDDTDAALDAADQALDDAADMLTGLGLEVVSELPSAVVALGELSEAAGREALLDRMLELSAPDRVEVSVVVHAGHAWREPGDAGQVWRGHLLEISEWVGDDTGGVTATAAFLDGIEDRYQTSGSRVRGKV
jgi:serine/threonine-protein kinase